MEQPLAEILRPQSVDQVIGQSHLLGEKGPISAMINNRKLTSMILWGPPGTGKTTIARLLARQLGYEFTELSGTDYSSKQLQGLRDSDQTQVIFIDEIHRLNKSQQAMFLGLVESGKWILIGATTENPSFEVISPLLSRARVFVLKNLDTEALSSLLTKAEQYYSESKLKAPQLSRETREYLVQVANGDARLLLNLYESVATQFEDQPLELAELKQAVGNMHIVYDKQGENHFDAISALHKSMRGSNANAAVYYLARMLEGGEDPLYIARRCLRFAAEDIGNADRGALVMATAAFNAVEKIGMPESNVILAQLVIYLASTKKSNQAYVAYNRAKADVYKYGNLPIPLKLRNAPTKLMGELGFGKGYKYAHDFSPEELQDEQYLPDDLIGQDYINE